MCNLNGVRSPYIDGVEEILEKVVENVGTTPYTSPDSEKKARRKAMDREETVMDKLLMWLIMNCSTSMQQYIVLIIFLSVPLAILHLSMYIFVSSKGQ